MLSNIDSSFMRPYVATYLLLIGIFILLKAGRMAPARDTPAKWTAPVGFAAGFLDASGGGGWGPVTTSTLVGSGHAPRMAIGSVNTTEFFVTLAASATFFVELGLAPLTNLIPLVLGGLIAAPFSGWAVKKVPARPLMVGVGARVIGLACWQLVRTFKLL
jgi:uncharacterized membrane protein YfcA